MEDYVDGLKQKGIVALSVAEKDISNEPNGDKEQFRLFVTDFFKRLLKEGCKFIYGGKLEEGGFTEEFIDIAKDYVSESTVEEKSIFKNYLAWPYYNSIVYEKGKKGIFSPMFLINAEPSEYVPTEQLKDSFISADNVETRFLYATSMTAMRKQAEGNSNARIIIGGKTTGFSGCMPGIMEEFLIALEYHHPVYLIGGFGGATKIITHIIEKVDGVTSATLWEKAMTNPNYKPLCEYYAEKGMPVDYTVLDGIKIEDLDNGLSVEQNLRLFHSLDIEEIESLVLLGLKTKNCI